MMMAQEERELVLRLSKTELFDPHVLLPHAELNEIVYRSVDTFVQKYKGETLTLTIFTDVINPVIQNNFREVYRAHYEDELRRSARYLKRRFVRFFVLLGISLTSYAAGEWLAVRIPGYNVFLNVVANIGTFCLWEVGYTHFATKDTVDEQRRILRAMNARIEFH